MNEFEQEKYDIINNITKLLQKYDKFTKKVSPSNWRTTGTHFTNLRQMKDDISSFKQINEKEKNFVQKWERSI